MLLNAVFTHPKRLSGSRQAHTGTSAVAALIWALLLVAVRPISAASRSSSDADTWTNFQNRLLKTD